MSVLTEKLLQARGAVARSHKKIVDKADEIIALEQQIDELNKKSFAGHFAEFAEQKKGLEQLAAELALMTNEPLDPLPDTAPGAHPTHTLVTSKDGKVVG